MDTQHKIKAIAIDLDGTLLTSDKRITETTIQTLRQVMEKGVHVVIATGRSLATAIRFVEQVGTTFPVVCYNGSCIYDPATKKDLWHISLNHEICAEIVRIGKGSPAHLHAFMDHELYFTNCGREADYLEPLSSIVGKSVDFESFDNLHFTKAMFIGEIGETERIRRHMHQRFGNQLHMVYSHPDYFEIMTGGATKGSALQRLMEIYGISADETMAFGDADNDKEMLSWARYGIAMGNAHDEVKAIAAGIAGYNDDDGVAKKIREVFDLNDPK
ncbi:MAG TPA: hypothetical protein DHV69_07990 [Sphaerochaeta sp.]|nr:MAG: hypothetical protein A2Y31_06345 [Spirochaetes bacterium GWC2_52_13]HCG63874.1 hypothetical protein [Sphaerochaeta sp.]HCJ95116.1 hypothetical protein [Sphaerochaeta sp.]